MAIYKGTQTWQPTSIFKGTTEISKVYRGSSLIWQKQSLKTGLVSCWELDDAVIQTVAEDSHNGYDWNTLGIDGLSKRQAGKSGYSYYFSGLQSPITTTAPSAFSYHNNFTMSLWLKSTDIPTSTQRCIFRYEGLNYRLMQFINGGYSGTQYVSFNFRLDGGATVNTDAANIASNNWYLCTVVVTLEAYPTEHFNIKFYIGVSGTMYLHDEKNINTGGRRPYPFTSMVMAGENISDMTFIGYLDQMAFWSRALEVAEIEYLYNSGNGVPFSNWT